MVVKFLNLYCYLWQMIPVHSEALLRWYGKKLNRLRNRVVSELNCVCSHKVMEVFMCGKTCGVRGGPPVVRLPKNLVLNKAH